MMYYKKLLSSKHKRSNPEDKIQSPQKFREVVDEVRAGVLID